ncbi:MAG: hypothetical protein IPN69_09305 [Acidobacteria bacterium]|nr:hypothetical protein [Acidobacteriota bacterium]MBK8810912.1 hypothetical protein [Acidobacteriota bacterium]
MQPCKFAQALRRRAVEATAIPSFKFRNEVANVGIVAKLGEWCRSFYAEDKRRVAYLTRE